MKKSEVTYTFTHAELLKIYSQGHRAGMYGMDWDELKKLVEDSFNYKWKETNNE